MIRTLLVVLVLAAAGGAAYWFFADAPSAVTETAAEDTQPLPVPVEAKPVDVGAITEEIAAIGTLKSSESVVVRPEIGGRVSDIHFLEGQPVEQGDPLVSLDGSIYRAELAEAEAMLELNRRNHERTQELHRKGAATARARDEALANLRTGQASVELARARLDMTTINAPFSGILGLRQVSVGDYLDPGQDLVNLEDIDPLKVDFHIPERHLGVLEVGQKIAVTVDAFPGKTFEGQVYAINPQIDPSGRSIAVRARITNRDRILRPGLFVRVNLVLDARDNAITIPEQAVVPRGEGRFVFKVVDGKAVMTKVKLGKRQAGEVEVVDGLSPGDVIVTAGQMKVTDGGPVRIVEAEAKPNA
jgi:membrane fusion protein (multidrug efflux system)